MSIFYPVADTPEEAIHAPKGLAAREREACDLVGGAVRFTTEAVGPAFTSQDAALAAFPGLAAQAYASLRPVITTRPNPPAKPINRDGRLWPEPRRAQAALWRFSIGYWRIEGGASAPDEAARKLRRGAEGETLDPQTLRALARQPLRPIKPQQPLDIGLFEVRPPDAPHILMPDE
jgi:hypothetical protein